MTLEQELTRLAGGITALRMVLEERRRKRVTPKLAGMMHELSQLHHEVEQEAETTMDLIRGARGRARTAFAGARDRVSRAVSDVESQVSEITEFLDGLEGGNGGPSFDGSSEQSGEQQPRSSSVAERR